MSPSLCLSGSSAPTGLTWGQLNEVGISVTPESGGGDTEDRAKEVRDRSKAGPEHLCFSSGPTREMGLTASAAPMEELPSGTGRLWKHPPTLSFFPSSTPMRDWDLAVSWEEAPTAPGSRGS